MTYQPTESQIERLVNSKTPRELAIGYLRARARELQLESQLKVMGGVAEIQNELMDAMAKGKRK